VYNAICPADPSQPPPALIRLAKHLLSICLNSASCERLFSSFGLILSKLRSKLKNERLLALAELKLHIRDELVRTGKHKEARTRQFGKKGIPAPTGAAGMYSLSICNLLIILYRFKRLGLRQRFSKCGCYEFVNGLLSPAALRHGRRRCR
jgi:hypothetical protein